MFGGNFAPTGWAFCQGQLLAINTNAALFSLLGTYYGGDGTTTFALPDLRGRVPIHHGTGPGLSTYALGEVGGVETVTLGLTQLPAHDHALAATGSGQTALPTNASFAVAGATAPVSAVSTYAVGTANTTLAGTTTASVGGGAAHNNIQPSLGLTYIIALSGIFPSRN